MNALFQIAAGIGTLLILIQFIAGGLGLEHHGDLGYHTHGGDDLQIRSLRAIAIGLAAFGFAGLIALRLGVWVWIAAPVALGFGAAGLFSTAWLMGRMARLEEDASVRVADALGERGTVYIPIGPDQPGKIQLVARGRIVEYRAVARDVLPTGTSVLVTGLRDAETLEVERA